MFYLNRCFINDILGFAISIRKYATLFSWTVTLQGPKYTARNMHCLILAIVDHIVTVSAPSLL